MINKISKCPHCHSMTKDIKKEESYYCGKCGELKAFDCMVVGRANK